MFIREIGGAPKVYKWACSLLFVHFLMLWQFRYSHELALVVLLFIGLGFTMLSLLQRRLVLSRTERWFFTLICILPLYTMLRELFGGRYSADQFDILSRLIFIIPVMIFLIRTGINAKLLSFSMSLAVVIGSAMTIWDAFHNTGRPRLNMHAITSADFIVYLGFANLIFVYLGVKARGWHGRWLTAVYVVLLFAFIQIVLSQTRGSWLAVPVFFVVSCFMLFRSLPVRYFYLLAVVIVIVFSVSYIVPGSPLKSRTDAAVSEFHDHMTSGGGRGSIGARLVMWEVSVAGFKIQPVFGLTSAGLTQFEEDSGLANYNYKKYGHQHNDFFDILAKRGLVGIACYLALFFGVFYAFNCYSSTGYREAGILLGVGYLVFGLTEATTNNYAAWSLFSSQLAILFAGGHREWLLQNQPELLNKFSTYWPDKPVTQG
ncbi:O-antigen ligase family protein [Reinekea thalattae]|uniref:O-antigen ligase family protein n=1 Tax=Reinekea thalattae TaxID=2593301 RepID=UPI0011CA8E8D|nr:O-antigen ligase family protein [Reinekea thalattae]